MAGNAKEISLGDEFGDVIVSVNHARIAVGADGSVSAHTSGDVDAYTNGSVRLHPVNDRPAAPTASAPVIFNVGDPMVDGTVYAGISPDTGRPMYTTREDAISTPFFGGEKLAFTFNQAAKLVDQLNAERYRGHDDWRMPTGEELNVLFNNRAAIGRFDGDDGVPAARYWSSTESYRGLTALSRNFSNGREACDYKLDALSLRLVRG
jgi:hypothetical protein